MCLRFPEGQTWPGALGVAGRWVYGEKREGLAPRMAEVSKQGFRGKGTVENRGPGVLKGRFHKQREQLTKYRPDQVFLGQEMRDRGRT